MRKGVVMSWTHNQRRASTYGVAGVLAVLALSVGACSSSGSSASQPSTAGNSATTSSQPSAVGNSATPASTAGSCAATASARLAKETAPLSQSMPTTPLATAKFKGKTVWDIELDFDPTTQGIASGYQAAGKAIGVNVRLYDGHDTPSGYNEGINQAVAQGAAVIVLDGIDPSVVPGALANAASKHIPVVDILGSSPTAPYPTGLVSHLTFDPQQLGAAQADYALAKSGCKGAILYSANEGPAVEDLLVAGARAEVAALCGSCGFYTTETTGVNLATQMSGQVEAVLQQHPDVKYVLVGSDPMAQYAGNALTTLGKTSSIGVVGIAGTNLPDMIKGRLPYEVADVVFMPLPTLGWFGMYEALQAASGQRNEVIVGSHTVDAANLHDPVQVPSYQQSFLKLFGAAS
jgi:ribose transport system substrate-binding protein